MTAMTRRRILFACLTAGTALTAIVLLGRVLAVNGFAVSDAALLLCFAITTPWIVIGFWNSAIGFGLLAFDRDWLRRVLPLDVVDEGPIVKRTAIVMPVYNEDAGRVFAHLEVVAESLERALGHAGGDTGQFELHLLSDSSDADVIAAEQAGLHGWRSDVMPLHYRRREDNIGYKAGNLAEFVDEHHERFDYMVVLDADSVMTGDTIARLVRTMQANPCLGILQTLAVGMPSTSAFARVFQFGMRHAMRPYTVGSAWWQGSYGPYWGHNAIIAMQPFHAHCALPRIAGDGPLCGHVLSHDQLEATLMRSAGYEVRVLPTEGGSFEENPPTLLDFIKRDLRWCQGNLQYLKLLRMPGVSRLGRLQLVLAILMYTAAPAWLAFLLIGIGQVVTGAGSTDTAVPLANHVTVGLALFGAMLTMNLAPKLFGIADVLANPERRRAWGGTAKVLGHAGAEAFYSMLLGPVMAVVQTLFIAGIAFGRRAGWTAQTRDTHRVAPDEALRALWLPSALGVVALVLLASFAPAIVPWAAPVLVAWLACIPLACLSAEPTLGMRLARGGVFAVPEERALPPELAALRLGPFPPAPGEPLRVGVPVAAPT